MIFDLWRFWCSVDNVNWLQDDGTLCLLSLDVHFCGECFSIGICLIGVQFILGFQYGGELGTDDHGAEEFENAPKGSTITVETENSTYHFLRRVGDRVKVQGGSKLPDEGAQTSLASTFIKVGERMFLELRDDDDLVRYDTLITSQVKRIYFHLPTRKK